MNFAMLQQAMSKKQLTSDALKGRGQPKALPFDVLDYIDKVDNRYNWVDNHFTDRDDTYLDVAAIMFDDCSFDEIEVPTETVDMLRGR